MSEDRGPLMNEATEQPLDKWPQGEMTRAMSPTLSIVAENVADSLLQELTDWDSVVGREGAKRTVSAFLTPMLESALRFHFAICALSAAYDEYRLTEGRRMESLVTAIERLERLAENTPLWGC